MSATATARAEVSAVLMDCYVTRELVLNLLPPTDTKVWLVAMVDNRIAAKQDWLTRHPEPKPSNVVATITDDEISLKIYKK